MEVFQINLKHSKTCFGAVYGCLQLQKKQIQNVQDRANNWNRRIFQRIQNLKLIGYACHQYT